MDSAGWDRRYADGAQLWSRHANRYLETEAEALTPGRAIDFACGQGRNAVWLAERGWEVTGVDFSRVGLEHAAELAAERGVDVKWVEADLLKYTPAPRAFDLALIFYLQLPSDVRRAVVRAAAESVAPGGRLLLVAHHADNIKDGYGGPQNPEVLYGADEVAEDLDGTGLRVERAERVKRPVQSPDGEQTAIDALLLARRP